MLADDIAGRPYNKAEHRRALLSLLNKRSDGSVEFKHQNISAVLKGLGEDWIPGYKPAFNFQTTLVDAVARWLALNPARAPTGAAPRRWPTRDGADLGRSAADAVEPAPAAGAGPDAAHRSQVRRGGPGRAQPGPRPRGRGARAGA
jgi:hypothetical protein